VRVTVISNTPGPNQSDFYEALSRFVDATIYYCSPRNQKWRGTEPEKLAYRGRFLFNLNPWPDRYGSLHLNPGVIPVVLRNTDLLFVQGYTSPTALTALLGGAATVRPFVFWGEMVNRMGRARGAVLKKAVVWPLLRRAEAILTMGPRGAASYADIGVRPERIHQVPYSCKLASYLAVPARRPEDARPRRVIALTAQLIQRKRVDVALAAFLQLADAFPNWDLKIAGDGPLLSRLEASVPDRMKQRVHFLGFMSKAEQPRFYAESDIFLLTSDEDGWGMVVPESMATGLPVVCTDAVESAQVLLSDGYAGVSVQAGSVKDTAAALERLMSNQALRLRLGENARLRAAEYDAEVIAKRCALVLQDTWKRYRAGSPAPLRRSV